MASKDKGGAKGSKTAASKTLKEKRAAKKAKGKGGSGSTDWSGSKQPGTTSGAPRSQAAWNLHIDRTHGAVRPRGNGYPRVMKPIPPDSLRVAMLAPISWRVPPRHYGPWEQFVSLLTEGLVARGVDVTLFATADSVTSARLVGDRADRLLRGPDARRQGLGVPAHRRGVRAGRRVRPDPQQLRLPAAHLQRAGRHAGRHHDPRLLVRAHRAGLSSATTAAAHYVAISDADRHPSARLRGHDPPRHRHGGVPAGRGARATTCCSSGASTPTRAPRRRSRSRRAPACRS